MTDTMTPCELCQRPMREHSAFFERPTPKQIAERVEGRFPGIAVSGFYCPRDQAMSRFPDHLPFEPLTDEQVTMLLLGTDDVLFEMSRPTMINAVVLLAREVKHWRDGSPPPTIGGQSSGPCANCGEPIEEHSPEERQGCIEDLH